MWMFQITARMQFLQVEIIPDVLKENCFARELRSFAMTTKVDIIGRRFILKQSPTYKNKVTLNTKTEPVFDSFGI